MARCAQADTPRMRQFSKNGEAMADKPKITLTENTTYYLMQGQPVRANGLPSTGEVLIFDPEQRFLGLGVMDEDGLLAPKRLLKTQK